MRFVGLEHVPTKTIPKYEVERAKKAAAAAAEASGSKGPLVYIGAGISSLVFCDERERAFKAARSDDETLRDLFEEEAAWLKDAADTSARPHVAKLYRYRPELVVIERECVKGGAGRPGQQEDRARDVHEKITKTMRAKGWGPPEFKSDSYVMHETRGPVLVDAGFASRFGENYLHHAKKRLDAFQKRLRDGAMISADDRRALDDTAWALRMELLEKRLTAAQADPVLEQLYSLGGRRNPAGCTPEQHAKLKATRWSQLKLAGKGTSRWPDGTVLEYRNCPACKSTLVKQIAGPELEENPPRKKPWLAAETERQKERVAELERRHEHGVFVWRADGRYPRADAVAVYKRESDAAKKADKLNETDPRYVVRTIFPERAKPNPERS